MNPVMESEDSMTGHPLIGDSQKQRLLNNTIYYYLLNLQGDVVRIVNTSGTTVASYDLIGFSSYFVNVLTPSVVGYHLGGTQYQSNYYSYVYEYTAEVLGEVNRPNYTYSSTIEDLWGAYLFYTLIYP